MNTSSPLMTVAEAAETLRLQQSTVRKWLLHKKLGYVKLGRRVFIQRTDIELLIAESVVPAEKKLPTPVVPAKKKAVAGGS